MEITIIPKISVIIPTYNRAYIIAKSIESVLNQTYSNFEIIIVDDGSNDNTLEIIESFNDPRIKYLQLTENRGTCYARNFGIKKALGDYIAFHDSDDICLPQRLEKQLLFLEKTQSNIVFCSFKRDNYINLTHQIKEEEIHKILLKWNCASTVTIFGKRECFLLEPLDDNLKRFDDWDLMIRLSKRFKVKHHHDVLIHVFRQKNSISEDNTILIDSIEYIRSKYYNLGWINFSQNAYFYSLMGCRASEFHLPHKIRYYFLALKSHPHPKYALLFLLSLINLDQFIKKKHLKFPLIQKKSIIT